MAKKKQSKKQLKKAAKKAQKATPVKKSFWTNKFNLVAILVILTLSFVSFYPALEADKVNWDDDRNFYENDNITSINENNFWENTVEIFKNHIIGGYNPLSTWTFAVEKRLHNETSPPWPTLKHAQKMHLTNVLLHLLCVFLVYRIALGLGLNQWGALFTALLFGVHPMRVESVAWITERKDVLYGAFFLGAMYYYIKFLDEGRKKLHLGIILVLFTCSLFSKIQAVSLPISFMAIDYLKGRKLELRLIWEKWFYLIMSLAIGITGIYFLKQYGTLENKVDYSIFQRLFVGSWSFMIYLIKSIIPYEMVPLYPYKPQMPAYFYPSMIMLPVTLAALWYSYKKKWKHILFGLVFFIVNIVFLLQILGAGQGFQADRFTYIAYFGLFFIYGYGIQQLPSLFPSAKKFIYPVAGLLMLTYVGLSFQQSKIWKDSGTLWTHVLKSYNNITLPYGNRANFYRDTGQKEKALADYSKVISLKGDAAAPYNSRGRLYFNTVNNRDTLLLALADYTKAIELEPNDGEYYANRGATYARLGRNQEALADLSKCIEIKPDHAVGYLNRSVIYNNAQQYDLALKDIQSYLKINPNNSDLWYESARIKRIFGQNKQAIGDYDKAIRLNPKGLYYYERAKCHYSAGNKANAKQDLLQAKQRNVRFEPGIEEQIMGG